jgi:hypothetical protein
MTRAGGLSILASLAITLALLGPSPSCFPPSAVVRLHEGHDRRPDMLRQLGPCLYDLCQLRVNGALFAVRCAGFCALFRGILQNRRFRQRQWGVFASNPAHKVLTSAYRALLYVESRSWLGSTLPTFG